MLERHPEGDVPAGGLTFAESQDFCEFPFDTEEEFEHGLEEGHPCEEGPSPLAIEPKELMWGGGAFLVLAVLMRFWLFPAVKQILEPSTVFDALDLPAHVITRDRDTPLERIGGFLPLRAPRAGDMCRALKERGVFTDYRGDILRLGPAPYLSDRQLRDGIDHAIDLGHDASGPVAGDAVHHLLPERRRTARVRRRDGRRLRRPSRDPRRRRHLASLDRSARGGSTGGRRSSWSGFAKSVMRGAS